MQYHIDFCCWWWTECLWKKTKLKDFLHESFERARRLKAVSVMPGAAHQEQDVRHAIWQSGNLNSILFHGYKVVLFSSHCLKDGIKFINLINEGLA